MAIVPDTKDWTFVLTRPCPECGYDASAIVFAEIPDRLVAIASAWDDVLCRPGVRERPSADRWSELEYGCHVRDVFGRFSGRLRVMLEETDPTFPNWDQDKTAVEDRYGEQDPAVVRRELSAAAWELAEGFRAVPEGALGRTGTRSDGARFTVETLGRYLVHDPVHHLWDVGDPPSVLRVTPTHRSGW
jgi:hypothetical protein